MKTAIYTNKATGEIYEIGGLKNIGQAWNLYKTACYKMNWNTETFALDVKVTIK